MRDARGLVADNDKTPLKATQKSGSHPEDGSTMPRSVAVVQSPLATQWIILANRIILAKLFYGSAVAADAMRCSGSVRTVTVVNVIAVRSAAFQHVGNSGGAPIAAISRVLKDD